jgi:ribonuclease P protein subunit RPR2
VPDAILFKPEPLTADERQLMERHTVIGWEIVRHIEFLGDATLVVRSHHERWDGRGYPDRLAGEAIPIGARILGAVEIYDALTTSRPYQEKMLPELAVERLRDLVGTVLDPAVHRALQAVVARREALVFLDDGRA